MQTIWLSPTEYITGDPTLQISYPFVSHPETIVTCTTPGDLKWLSMGLRLPPRVRIEELKICYQVSNPTSYISQVRLLVMDTPDQANVIYDDGTDLKSTEPACYISQVGGKVPTPDMAVTLALRLNFQHKTHEIMLGGVGCKISPIDLCENRHLLGEFGPYSNVPDAEATFKNALAVLIAQGGGVLCIPRDAPQDFYPRNLEQNHQDGPAVTIFDYRKGIERIYVPPMGTSNTGGQGGRGGRLIERDLSPNLGWQDVFSTEYIQSRYLGGASSYLQSLTQAVTTGANQKLYVPSHRGLFIGQTLRVTGEQGGYGGVAEFVIVKQLDLDQGGPYFVADLTHNHPQGAYIYNKNVVNGLTVEDTSNCDNQSMSLIVNRKTYGSGDTFGISTRLGYQGDIMSAGGDEGGVGIASQIEHDLDCFRGEVESWNPQTRELVYKDGLVISQKLGTSRPLINMNPNKWITSGKVRVTPPGNPASKIIGTPEVGWDQSIVGRFIAIDDPSEYYGPADGFSNTVHRWWHITALEDAEEGYKHLYVEKTWWWVNINTGPSLFRYSNYTTGPQHIVELDYIIAPGAWVSDVRRAVAGNTPGLIGQATPNDERTLVLAPSPSMSTSFDFEPGDLIVNPPGPNPWIPTAFRARHFDNFPGLMKGASFLSENHGRVQIGAGLLVFDSLPDLPLDEVLEKRKDREPSYDAGVYIFAATNSAIRIRGPVQSGAIDLWQQEGNEKKIRWFREGGASASTLHARPDNGDFVFAGGNIDHMNNGSIKLKGLSATNTPAQNLRDFNVPIAEGETQLQVTFPAPEADSNYAVLIECSWITNKAVKDKFTTGFTVIFDQPAQEGSETVDWLLVR